MATTLANIFFEDSNLEGTQGTGKSGTEHLEDGGIGEAQHKGGDHFPNERGDSNGSGEAKPKMWLSIFDDGCTKDCGIDREFKGIAKERNTDIGDNGSQQHGGTGKELGGIVNGHRSGIGEDSSQQHGDEGIASSVNKRAFRRHRQREVKQSASRERGVYGVGKGRGGGAIAPKECHTEQQLQSR